jgi:hypothetical protein
MNPRASRLWKNRWVNSYQFFKLQTPPLSNSPGNHINADLGVSVSKDVNNALKDMWIKEETTDIVETINALERKVRKIFGNVAGLLAVLFILRCPAAHCESVLIVTWDGLWYEREYMQMDYQIVKWY